MAIHLLLASLLLFTLLSSGMVLAATTGQETKSTPRQRNILFSSLSTKEGLAQIAVNAIVQDHQGFMWFGTQEGLSRYNGYRFDNFFHKPEDLDSLSHDWIWTLLVDDRGMLWVGTDGGGMDRYDPDSGIFINYTHDREDASSLSHDRVRVIHQSKDGTLWIGTDGGGLDRLDPTGSGFVHYRHDPDNPDGLPNGKVLAILEDRNGFLWIGTYGGLARLDTATGGFLVFQHDPSRSNSLGNDRIHALYEDPQGHLWIGTDGGGLNLFDPARGSFKRFLHDPNDPTSLSHNTVRNIHRDEFGTLWVGTSHGLNQWIPQTQSFLRYFNDPSNPASLADNWVKTIFQDQGGVLWLGTANGISRWNYVSDAFTSFGKTTNDSSYLNNGLVTAVDQTINGQIWVGTYGGGLSRIDPIRHTTTHYRHDPDDPNTLSSNVVMSVFVDRDNLVWVGTRKDGLNRLDPSTGTVRHFRHDPSNLHSLGANGVTRIQGDADGTLWVATYGGGLNRLPAGSERFEIFRHNPQDPYSLSSDRVLALYRDSSETLWIGTEDAGFNALDKSTGTFTRYRQQPDKPESLGSDTAWEILEGRDGSLWIGTRGGGLNRWLPEDRKGRRNRFVKYGVSEGLLSNTVHGILLSDTDALWLSSNRGLTRLDPETGNVRHFDNQNALKNNDFTQGARMRGRDGTMMFGGAEGLVIFHPERIHDNTHLPPIAVTALSRMQPLVTSSGVGDDVPLVGLNYTDYSITFDFAALDFSSPDKNRYRYRLKGFDRDWIDPHQYLRATYTNLPAGTFRFEVKAANNDGVWNKAGAAIDLRVNPPPWMSVWSYVLYALVALGFLSMYAYVQRKKSLKEAQQREQLKVQVEERTQELAERNEELVELNVKLKESSMTDTLTGLRNRRYFYEIIETEIAKINRQAAEPGASKRLFFMMIDLDGFKTINDTHGHNAGDRALQQVRDILNHCCRSSDTVVRWGGDEFLIVGDTTDPGTTEHFAERLRLGLAKHDYDLGNGSTGHLSGSIGFVLYPFVADIPGMFHWEAVAAIADQAAYIAKENQRNAWVGIYSRVTAATASALSGISNDVGGLSKRGLVEIKTSITCNINVLKQQANRTVQ